MQPFNPPCVLSIAGTDPSGGAGIQADIKAISATGAYAASVITALVAQNTQGVQSILEVAPEFVVKQLDSVISDLNIVAVKIGMIHNQR
jgi:hydroxymethylpyrimidine/phosphomethylpyrimidine kinase